MNFASFDSKPADLALQWNWPWWCTPNDSYAVMVCFFLYIDCSSVSFLSRCSLQSAYFLICCAFIFIPVLMYFKFSLRISSLDYRLF